MNDDIGFGALVGGAIVAFIGGLWAWLTQRGKSRSEIEIAALAQWEKISKGWSDRLVAVEKELADVRKECAIEIEALVRDHSEGMAAMREKHSADIEALRRDHAAELEQIRRDHSAEIEEMRKQHRTEMRSLRELNEGLQRQIAQNSQSTAHLLGKTPTTLKEPPDGK